MILCMGQLSNYSMSSSHKCFRFLCAFACYLSFICHNNKISYLCVFHLGFCAFGCQLSGTRLRVVERDVKLHSPTI